MVVTGREMAAVGADIVVLGSVPINLSKGYASAEQMIASQAESFLQWLEESVDEFRQLAAMDGGEGEAEEE